MTDNSNYYNNNNNSNTSTINLRQVLSHNPDIAHIISCYAHWNSIVYPSIKSGKVRKSKTINNATDIISNHNITMSNNNSNTQTQFSNNNTATRYVIPHKRSSNSMQQDNNNNKNTNSDVIDLLDDTPYDSIDDIRTLQPNNKQRIDDNTVNNYNSTSTTPTRLANIFTTNPYKQQQSVTKDDRKSKYDNKFKPSTLPELPPLTDTAISDNIQFNTYKPPTFQPSFTFNRYILYDYIKPNRSNSALQYVYYENDYVAILYDKYPKSTVHLLIVPKCNIERLDDVDNNNQPQLLLLQYMHNIGIRVIQHLQQTQYSELQFDLGYHRIPSLYLLHCHLISTDFFSDNLKKKHRWNSFNTPFFVRSKLLYDTIQTKQNIHNVLISTSQANKYHNQDMRCNRLNCNAVMNNIPTLKHHINQCKHKLSSGV